VAPVGLRLIRETANLYLQQVAEDRPTLLQAAAIRAFWSSRLGGLPNEVFEVAYLDSSCRLLPQGVDRFQEGTVDRAIVYPRQVFEAALRRRAAALLIAHNHPNGNPQPSEQDRTLTRALVLAGTPLEIRVLDHLIVAESGVFSFRDEGLL